MHVEVQGQRAAAFPKRMFTYHVRLLDHFDRDVISLAILTDGSDRWRPAVYERGGAASRVTFAYTVIKLVEWRGRMAELEASANPFAVVVRAHLTALATRRNRAGRLGAKLTLVRGLYERGYTADQVRDLFRFIDWVIQLPVELDPLFWAEVQAEEEARGMPYITSVERIGRERGRAEGRAEGRVEGRAGGLRDGLTAALRARFGVASKPLVAALQRIDDVATLERLTGLIGDGAPFADVQSAMLAAAAPSTDAQ